MKNTLLIALLFFTFGIANGQKKKSKTSSKSKITNVHKKNPEIELSISQDVSEIIGIYKGDTDVSGTHLYLILNNKMLFIFSYGSSSNDVTDPNNWIKKGTYKFDGQKILFDYGGSFEYIGNGYLGGGSITFKWERGL